MIKIITGENNLPAGNYIIIELSRITDVVKITEAW